MTDYLNPHRIYPDCPSRRIDNPRGSEEKGGHMTDTGLVPCGCGGKAGFHYSVIVDNDCYVECGICGEHSKVALCEEKARDAWNAALRSPDPDTGCPECSWIDPALSDRNYCKNCGRRLRDALTANDMENVCRFVEVEG